MAKKTPLYAEHVSLKGKMVEFAGWDMPLHYGSQLQEHLYVRQDAGVFDVSHMTIVDVLGPGAREYLRYLLANDVDRLQHRGKAFYTVMLNHEGGILDDLIVYFIDVQHYRLVLNAATHDADLEWMNTIAKEFSVGLYERTNLAMLAIQGPNAIAKTQSLFTPLQLDVASTLHLFEFAEVDDLFIARTGYTGEDGYEIILPAAKAIDFWQKLIAKGVSPCGLGARDTLRLEAGLNLYGSDMNTTTTPLESGLAWTVAWEPRDRLFIGRAALELQKTEGIKRKLVGIVLQEKGIPRSHQKVLVDNLEEGEITSGTFSPSLSVGIALARVPKETGQECKIQIRDKLIPARVIKLPFVRYGKKIYE